jgi:hypothetical protein
MSKAKKQALATPQQNAELIRQLGLDACRSADGSFETTYWYFTQLGNLFSAIKALDPDKFSNASMLAELGEHLTADWQGFVDCSREEVKKYCEGIKTVPLASEVQS